MRYEFFVHIAICTLLTERKCDMSCLSISQFALCLQSVKCDMSFLSISQFALCLQSVKCDMSCLSISQFALCLQSVKCDISFCPYRNLHSAYRAQIAIPM